MQKQDKRRPRLYSTLVELSTGDPAFLLIMRFPTSFGAQLTSYDDFLRQVSAKVERPDFEATDVWHLLALVEKGFQRVHGIGYEYMPPSEMSPDEWATEFEKRANDPRYVVWEDANGKGWHIGVNATDLPAMHREMRLKKAH
ncbi:hypothetical protein [Rhizobium sp. LjRoot258]|uniref:hypothetical protein n=1 Tax=Rhizobium sp. LjRoot258 TaxID=3342299 RepID=UPI003ECCF1BD